MEDLQFEKGLERELELELEQEQKKELDFESERKYSWTVVLLSLPEALSFAVGHWQEFF